MTTPPLPITLGFFMFLSELGLNLVKRSRAGAISKDRNSLLLALLLNGTGCGLATYFMFQPPEWTLWRGELLTLSGLCLFLSGMALRWYAIIYLGRFFTTNVAIAQDHRLIDTGPYRLVRHPSYSGSLLMVVGFGLCLGNIASLLSLMAFAGLALFRRIQVEEHALTEAFGEQYHSYMRRTKRLIPFLF